MSSSKSSAESRVTLRRARRPGIRPAPAGTKDTGTAHLQAVLSRPAKHTIQTYHPYDPERSKDSPVQGTAGKSGACNFVLSSGRRPLPSRQLEAVGSSHGPSIVTKHPRHRLQGSGKSSVCSGLVEDRGMGRHQLALATTNAMHTNELR